jgi:hypothetical protein
MDGHRGLGVGQDTDPEGHPDSRLHPDVLRERRGGRWVVTVGDRIRIASFCPRRISQLQKRKETPRPMVRWGGASSGYRWVWADKTGRTRLLQVVTTLDPMGGHGEPPLHDRGDGGEILAYNFIP